MDRTDWPDSRITALERRVEALAQLPVTIAKIEGKMGSLDRGVKHISEKIDELQGDPIAERRSRNRAILVAVIAASASGIVTLALYLALGVGLK
jgi:hypothetical protein